MIQFERSEDIEMCRPLINVFVLLGILSGVCGWYFGTTGAGGGGMFPTMLPGGGGGWPTPGIGGPTTGGIGGGWPTPGGGGGVGPTSGGSWPTMNPGQDGGWFPVMTPGSDSGCGETTPVQTDSTCDGNGGQCLSECLMNQDSREDLDCGTGVVCCLANVLSNVTCGNPYLSRGLGARIVGGNEALAHSWPWQVSLQNIEEFHFCGGSLISDEWVVTAAHCVEGQDMVYNVVLGEHDRTTESGREVYRQGQVFVHEGYSSGAPYPNDIALLKLNEPVELSSDVFPVCLPETGSVFDTSVDECWISGWGDTKGTGDETKLNEIRMTITNNDDCGEQWGSGCILDTNICIGDGGTGACNGDSGGPLSCLRSGESRYMLAGLTSWGYNGCQTKGYPNVYTRLSEYRSWVEAAMRKNM